MNKYAKYIILIAILYFTVWYFFLKKSKYYKFFQKQLGFGSELLDKFTAQELKDSYNYITNFTRKGIVLKPYDDYTQGFYNRLIAINKKFHIFSSLPEVEQE